MILIYLKNDKRSHRIRLNFNQFSVYFLSVFGLSVSFGILSDR